jgi:hypothetical protein
MSPPEYQDGIWVPPSLLLTEYSDILPRGKAI